MTRDIETLQLWIRIVAVIASVCTTTLPIVYSTFPWRTRLIGRLFMLQTMSLALTVDVSTMFAFWKPKDVLIVFWVDALMLTLLAISAILMAFFMLKLRSHSLKGEEYGI